MTCIIIDIFNKLCFTFYQIFIPGMIIQGNIQFSIMRHFTTWSNSIYIKYKPVQYSVAGKNISKQRMIEFIFDELSKLHDFILLYMEYEGI